MKDDLAHRSEIAACLLDYGAELLEEAPDGIKDLGLTDEERRDLALVNDLDGHPHAFVLGCVMDRQIKAQCAWELSERVRERVGTFEFEALERLTGAQTRKMFREPSPLHRFPRVMADYFHSAVQRIATRYDGNASLIWAGKVRSATLVRRFLEFDGVGPKIATMAANILARDFKVPLADRHYIDISVDVQVKRVFSRLGPTSRGAFQFEVVYVAREMNPDYPGIFDLPAWRIGRDWCRPGKPQCPDCRMRRVCPGVGRFHPHLQPQT